MPVFRLQPLKEHQVRDLLGWQYEPPYDFYDPPRDRPPEDYIGEFLNPHYQFHAILDRDGRFAGFCSFGIDGQVPGGDYRKEALDIGLGMRPELTGQGIGNDFVSAILAHAARHYSDKWQRMTVADFNHRAIRLYQKFGFTAVDSFTDSLRATPYTILLRRTPMAQSWE